LPCGTSRSSQAGARPRAYPESTKCTCCEASGPACSRATWHDIVEGDVIYIEPESAPTPSRNRNAPLGFICGGPNHNQGGHARFVGRRMARCGVSRKGSSVCARLSVGCGARAHSTVSRISPRMPDVTFGERGVAAALGGHTGQASETGTTGDLHVRTERLFRFGHANDLCQFLGIGVHLVELGTADDDGFVRQESSGGTFRRSEWDAVGDDRISAPEIGRHGAAPA